MAGLVKQVIDGYNSIWELRGRIKKQTCFKTNYKELIWLILLKRYASWELAFHEFSTTDVDHVLDLRHDCHGLGTELHEKPTRFSVQEFVGLL